MMYETTPSKLLAANMASYPKSTANQLPREGPRAMPALPATPR